MEHHYASITKEPEYHSPDTFSYLAYQIEKAIHKYDINAPTDSTLDDFFSYDKNDVQKLDLPLLTRQGHELQKPQGG